MTTFAPVALLLAYFRDEGAYRVGQYDSLNRMFMQVVPLAVLYVVAVYSTTGRVRPHSRHPKDRGVEARSRRPHHPQP